MKSLKKPTYDILTVYFECISVVRNESLKARLTEIGHLIVAAATEFNEKVSTGDVYTIIRETVINHNISAKELESVYGRMLRKKTPGRVYYDQLFISAPMGICPYCSQREVSQIDHYLPKGLYPRLAVVPLNLIPSCSDCNKTKLSKYPIDENEEFLHPYYDTIENDLWLSASIVHSNPPVFQFSVIPPLSWDNLLSNRVENYFKSLKLNKLYSVQSAVHLTNINYRLNRLYQSGGVNSVRNFLTEEALSRISVNQNSWQSAMFKSMVKDDWFCSGGFGLDVV